MIKKNANCALPLKEHLSMLREERGYLTKQFKSQIWKLNSL